VKSISGKDFCKVLEAHGWTLERIRGSHHIFGQPENPTILTVPVHGNKDLKRGTLHKLLRESGLTEDDL
jgi:predicted RNA binding protein YcfA (HicA-like mRNA interferase family)